MLCTAHDLQKPDVQEEFANAISQISRPDYVLRSLRLATHFLLPIAAPKQDASLNDNILLLFSAVLEKAAGTSGVDTQSMKRMLFKESDAMRQLLCTSHSASLGPFSFCWFHILFSDDLLAYQQFIHVSLDPQSPADQTLAAEYCTFWGSKLPISFAQDHSHVEVRRLPESVISAAESLPLLDTQLRAMDTICQ